MRTFFLGGIILTAYIIRRIILIIPVILGVTFIVFLAARFVPGDTAEVFVGEEATQEAIDSIRRHLGLDQPVLVQFGIYLGNIIRGDLGRSSFSRRPVIREIKSRVPATLQIAVSAVIISIVLGIPAGIISALYKNSFIDNIVTTLALIGVSIPAFWFGLMMILLLSVNLGLLPAHGSGTFRHLIMPSFTLGTSMMAIIARMTRSSMLEVIESEYVRTAKAKGLPYSMVILKHALKNTLIPVVTIIGMHFGALLSGAVVTETVFGWPGIGRLMIESILQRDYPMIQGVALVIALGFVFSNLAVDIIYSFLDPRIEHR